MKKSLSIIAASLISISTMAQAPAFPGAEGHGRFVTGGRGGKIYHVTNLNDSGTGSFREAVKSGNRIIVFDVAGVVALKSDLKIADNITILGQTAPSPGITLRYYTVQPGSNNSSVSFASDVDRRRTSTTVLMPHGSATRRVSSSTTAPSAGVSTRWLRSMTTTTSPCSGVPWQRASPTLVTPRVLMAMAASGVVSWQVSTTTSWLIS